MKGFYIYSGGKPYPVSKEVYDGINQMTNRIYYVRRSAGQCRATRRQRSRCEGDCCSCRNYVNQEENADNDWMVSSHMPPSIEDEASCAGILDAMQEIDPDGRLIGRLYLLHYGDADIAKILGISRNAYYRRKSRIQRYLHKYLSCDNN